MSSSGFDITTTHHIEEIGQANWDALSAPQPFASYRWYRFGERVLADTLPVYISLSRRGETLARASFWLVRNEPLPLVPGPFREAFHLFLRFKPLLICRAPLADASG